MRYIQLRPAITLPDIAGHLKTNSKTAYASLHSCPVPRLTTKSIRVRYAG